MNVHFVTLKSCFDAAVLVWQEPNMNLWDLINQWNECRGPMHYDVTANRAARSSASTATLSALAKVHCLDRRREWTWSCDANNIGSSSALAQGTLVTWVTPNNRIKLKPRKTTSDKRHRKSRWTCRSSLQLWWCGHLIRNTLKYPQLWHSGVIIRTHDWN